MPYDIIVGRDLADAKKFGRKGAVLIGKSYVKMGNVSSLSNNVYLDVARSHVVFVCGKRGSGKSWSLGVIAEGISDLPSEVKENIAVVIFDTMGIYWTMKFKNEKDAELLDNWALKPKGLDVKIYVPFGYFEKAKEQGIPTDFAFSIAPSELTAEDWILGFELGAGTGVAVLIEKIIGQLNEKGAKSYDIDEIISEIERDKSFSQEIKNEAVNRFKTAKLWGIFSKDAIAINDIIKAGQVSVLDTSAYVSEKGGWGAKALVIGLIAKKVFVDRMIIRKEEEVEAINIGYSYFRVKGETEGLKKPMVWFVIDEGHEFLPKTGKTAASDALITLLREGRQPGISLVLASQQPGKIHSDVLTQTDIVIAHRLTAKMDILALGSIMQTYLTEDLIEHLNKLPAEKGAALILDDNSERIYPIRVRPRVSWHGGEAPSAVIARRTIE
ncbi:ATP-binding protein [archaeon]|nr:ATP-binding protein [archaeon]